MEQSPGRIPVSITDYTGTSSTCDEDSVDSRLVIDLSYVPEESRNLGEEGQSSQGAGGELKMIPGPSNKEEPLLPWEEIMERYERDQFTLFQCVTCKEFLERRHLDAHIQEHRKNGDSPEQEPRILTIDLSGPVSPTPSNLSRAETSQNLEDLIPPTTPTTTLAPTPTPAPTAEIPVLTPNQNHNLCQIPYPAPAPTPIPVHIQSDVSRPTSVESNLSLDSVISFHGSSRSYQQVQSEGGCSSGPPYLQGERVITRHTNPILSRLMNETNLHIHLTAQEAASDKEKQKLLGEKLLLQQQQQQQQQQLQIQKRKRQGEKAPESPPAKNTCSPSDFWTNHIKAKPSVSTAKINMLDNILPRLEQQQLQKQIIEQQKQNQEQQKQQQQQKSQRERGSLPQFVNSSFWQPYNQMPPTHPPPPPLPNNTSFSRPTTPTHVVPVWSSTPYNLQKNIPSHTQNYNQSPNGYYNQNYQNYAREMTEKMRATTGSGFGSPGYPPDRHVQTNVDAYNYYSNHHPGAVRPQPYQQQQQKQLQQQQNYHPHPSSSTTSWTGCINPNFPQSAVDVRPFKKRMTSNEDRIEQQTTMEKELEKQRLSVQMWDTLTERGVTVRYASEPFSLQPTPPPTPVPVHLPLDRQLPQDARNTIDTLKTFVAASSSTTTATANLPEPLNLTEREKTNEPCTKGQLQPWTQSQLQPRTQSQLQPWTQSQLQPWTQSQQQPQPRKQSQRQPQPWYICEFCVSRDQRFDSLKGLLGHEKEHHKIFRTEESLNYCHICGKKLASRINLGRHMMNCHHDFVRELQGKA